MHSFSRLTAENVFEVIDGSVGKPNPVEGVAPLPVRFLHEFLRYGGNESLAVADPVFVPGVVGVGGQVRTVQRGAEFSELKVTWNGEVLGLPNFNEQNLQN